MIFALFVNGRVTEAYNDQTIDVLPDGMTELTIEEFDQRFDLLLENDQLIFSPLVVMPSIEELSEAVRRALQAAIDVKARSLGFSGGNALMLYVGFPNPFQQLSQTFASWEVSVWVEADAYKAEVIAGTKPMLSGPEAVALMPDYPE